ncbi:hypothetical protein [Pedobacter sandarakinus]|uniref:hypothetical protein n=1 Tax=Pedobacter sandarakinus TaxID=353156 RepID=UPI002246BD53|nr:hypothetical protein [Pedobacter sandarakinus]MCX2574080.1 hypothetical protein [Pedobacter sandarakinus]
MKKIIYALFLVLVAAYGLVFANRELKKEQPEGEISAAASTVDGAEGLKKWEASPDGVKFKRWKVSPTGKHIRAGAAKINKALNDSTEMEAVITSLSLPPGSRLGFGMLAKINGVDCILKLEPDASQLRQLKMLKVNDKLILKGRHVSLAPSYAYPIVWGESVLFNGSVIYKRAPPKGGC